MTGGMESGVCLDAVGMEAHKLGVEAAYDRARQAVRLESDRPYVLRGSIQACRKRGTTSFAGVYGGVIDKVPVRAALRKDPK
jgi:threonine dehydrogenase-like Zn-dependent dehydrogenase